MKTDLTGLNLMFLSSELIKAVLVAFVCTLIVMLIISLHVITDSSAILFKHSLFSQIHLLGT